MQISKIELGEGLKIALNALRTNRMRTILTTLGIFIGVIVVTVIISVIQGLNAYVKKEMSGLGADTLYISKMPWIIRSYEEYLEYVKRRQIEEKHYKFILEHATLADVVAPELDTRKTVKYHNESLDNVTVIGTTEAYSVTADAVPEQGRFFNMPEVEFRKNLCLIGFEVAEKLFQDENPIGKRIKIGAHHFTITGVLMKKGQIFGESQDNTAIIPYTVFEKHYGRKNYMTILVKPKDPRQLEALIDQLMGLMRRIRGLEAGKPDDFAINQQSQLMDLYNQLTRVLWIVLIGIGSISLVVGGIGIMNIMLVSVTERTREIGIRKAIGAKRRIIMWQFLVESMFISGIGVLLGILVSIAIALVVRKTTPLPVNISTWVLFLGVGFTVAIGLFFGLYPASKAAQLDPIVALRYE